MPFLFYFFFLTFLPRAHARSVQAACLARIFNLAFTIAQILRTARARGLKTREGRAVDYTGGLEILE